MVEQSEEGETAHNLVEVGSIDESPFDNIDEVPGDNIDELLVDNLDIAVENHESIIIPAIQPKEEKEEIPEFLEN